MQMQNNSIAFERVSFRLCTRRSCVTVTGPSLTRTLQERNSVILLVVLLCNKEEDKLLGGAMQAQRRMTRSIAAATFEEERKKSALLTRKELEEILKEPVPDLYPIMKAYSEKYFEGSVKGFTIHWVPQLRKRASKTIYSPMRKISMSKPLLLGLKKKIMIESLLHEMIHVNRFLFYESHHRDHGEQFVNMMTKVNKEAGLNVTISKEGSLQNIARLQTVWECNKCKRRLTVLTKGKLYCSNNLRARNHAKVCDGEWHVVQ